MAALAAKGVGGWWRIAKNLIRFGLRVGPEHPATPEFWPQALRDAGFVEACFHPVEAAADIVCGVRPPSGPGGRRVLTALKRHGRTSRRSWGMGQNTVLVTA